MTTLQPTTTTTQQTPRPSTETDRRHLLSPSGATSLLSSTQTTPRASLENPPQLRRGTLADPSTTQHPYRGFPSEAAYLAAFNEWAESKKYVQHDTNLVGFYGETTMQEYAARPRQEFGLSKRWRERKAKKEARRASAV
ncbi:hypothetical protein M409DRAFT_53459 [Zasmidium cellare ATCC 36951]|uniref:Uncharacterized protein n=1 Tax=Zasmidium cellare ATCC 36951 TaxID=1080233 RepID=A0A6A6CQU4_ZASCE|nr:uncharacterized protein M409DRAFT_53459 [Zasmidium cellare ATCC 36951]KAF2168149.1 hypothetical protein M409DRAFT_53459 [Zasmidium cellare ATCC 36951]